MYVLKQTDKTTENPLMVQNKLLLEFNTKNQCNPTLTFSGYSQERRGHKPSQTFTEFSRSLSQHTGLQHRYPAHARWPRIVHRIPAGVLQPLAFCQAHPRVSESQFHSLQLGQPEHCGLVVGHHLGRYSCGSLLKFLLWSAWSTVLMKESIIFLMEAVNGSKEGCLAPERLK